MYSQKSKFAKKIICDILFYTMKNPLVFLKNFIKREPVLFAALVLAIVAVCVVRPGVQVCLQAIDFRTLAILFSHMIVIKAF